MVLCVFCETERLMFISYYVCEIQSEQYALKPLVFFNYTLFYFHSSSLIL